MNLTVCGSLGPSLGRATDNTTRSSTGVLADGRLPVAAANVVPGNEVPWVELVEKGQAPLVVVLAVVRLRDSGAGEGGKRAFVSCIVSGWGRGEQARIARKVNG